MRPSARARAFTLGVAVSAIAVAALAPVASGASGATVTDGQFETFATGVTRGYHIHGHAHMVRTAGESSIVQIHVSGLTAGVTYGSHVHAARCDVGAADGHYMFPGAVDGGATAAHNEIWPGPITADGNGVANGQTKVGATAGATAVAVVIHDADGAKIACADLE
jgi:hypothetical protein